MKTLSEVTHMQRTRTTATTRNPARIVHYFYDFPGHTRAQAARALGLTPAAVSIITSHLINSAILIEASTSADSPNGRAVGLKVNGTRNTVIGVKFARTRIELGVFTLGGAMVAHIDFPAATNTNVRASLDAVTSKIRSLLAADPDIVGVGIAVPGPYFSDRGRIVLVTSLPAWSDVNFSQEFEASFSVPTLIIQDARAGALAHSLFDEQADSGSLAYLLLGEGIGLGVIDNGSLINGAIGAATEIGHVSLNVTGPACECGNFGCFEKYCSAVSVHQRLIDDGAIVPQARNLGHSEAFAALCQEAYNGNPGAKEFLTDLGTWVGYGCVTAINSFNPHDLILGDILAQAGPALLSPVMAVLKERVNPDVLAATRVRLSTLTFDPILSGAAASAIDNFLSNPTPTHHKETS